MKSSETILKYFLYISLICIGVIVGIAIHHYYDLPIAEAINIVDLATLVTTIFLAVYIPEVLDRRLQVKKDKKDLIERHIEDIQALYRKINLLVQGSLPITKKDYLVIKNTLDVSDHKLNTAITLLTYSNLKTSFSKEIAKIKRINKEHKELLWAEDMDEDGFSYPDDIQEKEELLYNKMDEATSLLIFKISEA